VQAAVSRLSHNMTPADSQTVAAAQLLMCEPRCLAAHVWHGEAITFLIPAVDCGEETAPAWIEWQLASGGVRCTAWLGSRIAHHAQCMDLCASLTFVLLRYEDMGAVTAHCRWLSSSAGGCVFACTLQQERLDCSR
jgi:hypothetical protein